MANPPFRRNKQGITPVDSLRNARKQFGAGLGSRLIQQPVRLGPAFDSARFHPVGTVPHEVSSQVTQVHFDQRQHHRVIGDREDGPYANRPVQISLRTMSGVWQRSTSIPSVILMARISSSINQRWWYSSAMSSCGYSSASTKVVIATNDLTRKPANAICAHNGLGE